MNISHNHTFSMFLLFVLFFFQVQGHFLEEKNIIIVMSPHELRGKRNGAIGSFRIPSYETYIIGSLLSPEDCHGCQVFEGDKPFKFRSYHPTIVLLDHGECSLDLKVYHAQMVGAAAVLITDIIDELLMILGSPEEKLDDNKVTEKILIPSFLIQLSIGNYLKTSLHNKEKVLLRIEKDHEIPILERWLIALAGVAGLLALKIIIYLVIIVVRKCLARVAPAAAAAIVLPEMRVNINKILE